MSKGKKEELLEMLTAHCAGVALTSENGLVASKVYLDDLADDLLKLFAKQNRQQLFVEDAKPCFEFSGKATKYADGNGTVLAVDTDGISLSNDDLPCKAYTLEEGVEYVIKLYKV